MKELYLTFQPEGGTLGLPLARNSILQGVFYRLLSAEPEFGSAVHDFDTETGHSYKLFCFSDILGTPKVRDRSIFWNGPCGWFLRAVDDRLIACVTEALSREPVLHFAGNACRVTSMELRSRIFFGGSLRFRMNTPIAVYRTAEDGSRCGYLPDTPDFSALVINNLRRKYAAVTGEEPEGEITFSVLSFRERDIRRVFYRNQLITACCGDYELRAPRELLDIAYYCGLGSKNALGLGTVGELL